MSSNARAFKPVTHVYLAEQALADAVDDGQVTIYEVDYRNGRIKTDSNGLPKAVGHYSVHPKMLEALRKHPAHFRAGVLGPDAYPDMLTGQMIIHPGGRVTPGETDVALNRGGPGPGPWLEHLWNQAYVNGQDPKAQAFVAGYLTHAAGDMYGHTYVNYFTGGAFHFKPNPQNAIKHIVLEGYIASKTPDPTFDASIAGISNFVHRNMVKGGPDSVITKTLLVGENADRSIPYIFSRLRNQLDAEIKNYYATKDKLGFVKARIYQAKHAIPTTYKEAWRDDIDRGLKEWPNVSHEVAKAMFFNSDKKVQRQKVKRILNDYANEHLISMSGAPDFVGLSRKVCGELIDSVIRASGLNQIEELINRIERDFVNYLFERGFGVSLDEMVTYLQNPAIRFDPILNVGPPGQRISREEFDEKELKLGEAKVFDYRDFPPAYNTVTMTKLLMMSQPEVDRMMKDLMPDSQQDAPTLRRPNAMLGFVETLDGSNQWVVNSKKMVVARTAGSYARIFMLQRGELPLR